MSWTSNEQAILEKFAAKVPPPAPPNNDDPCRAWTMKLAEQFAFTFPTAGWGTKQASPTRPPSTDCICTRSPFVGYDVLVSQGSPDQALANNPEPLHLAGQVYINVTPKNHLAGAEPGPTPVQPYPDEPSWWGAVFTPAIQAQYAEAHRSFPDTNTTQEGIRATLDGFRWWSRTGYKIRNGMTKEAAMADTIKELRAQLGLP